MRRLVCLILLAVAATPVASPVPAAAQAPVKRSTVLETDARLDKPVTLHWKKATVFEALREVSRQTGARLTPDRLIVDEPVMLAVTKVPAREVLAQLAELTHFTWLKDGGTQAQPTYLLIKDLAAVREEQEALTRAQREVLAAIQSELQRCREFSRMSPERAQKEVERADKEMEAMFKGLFSGGGGGIAELTSAKSQRRMLDGMTVRSVTSPTGRVMLEMLDGLTPGQWETVMAEEPLVFSTKPGEGELRMPARLADALRQNAPGFPFPKSIFSGFGPQVEEGLNQVDGLMKDQWGKADGFQIGVQLSMQVGSQPMGMLRVAPTPLGGEEGMSPLFAMAGLNLMGMPSILDEPTEDAALREMRLGADPVLGKKARLKLPEMKAPAAPPNPLQGVTALFQNQRRIADVLPAVEEAFGIRLIGDAFNRQAMAFFPPAPDAEQPLFKVLDQLAGSSRTWEMDGRTVRLKSKTWAHDRRCEIPLRYMKRWGEVRQKKGGFTLDDLAEIATLLRDEQVDSLMFVAMEAENWDAGELMMVSMNKDMLRFWGRLLPLQRRNLLGGQTIPARSLYPAQQQALLALSRPKGNSMFAFIQGIKPARSPATLGAAAIAMDVNRLDGKPEEGRTAPPPPGTAALYTLRVSLPSGQKDEYRLTLTGSGVRNGPTVTAPGEDEAPAAPVPPTR